MLMLGWRPAMAKDLPKAAPTPKSLVEVQGRLLDYEDNHPWCSYGQSAAMQAHGLGRSPWGRFELDSPSAYAGRTFEVLFKCGYGRSLGPALRSGVGRAFTLVLPEDFLLGTYSRIEDCDVGSAVAKRWRPVSTKPRRQ